MTDNSKPYAWAMRVMQTIVLNNPHIPADKCEFHIRNGAQAIAAEFDKTGLVEAVKNNLDSCESLVDGFCDTPGHGDMLTAYTRATEKGTSQT